MSLLRSGGIVCLSVPSASLYCSLDSSVGSERVVINFEGSSSMKPIIESLLEDYLKNNFQNVSINIATVGSSVGLQRVINGVGDFALVSHDINLLMNNENLKNQWQDRKLKTITLAKDAMFLIYKPPENCSKNLIISDKNVKDIYSLFSAHSFSGSKKTNLKEFISSEENCSVEVIPWVKGAGPIKSGTAKSFIHNPLLNKVCCAKRQKRETQASSDCDGTWWSKVSGGEYGDENQIYYVHESTALHWDSFKESPIGSITYLPSHFVFLNKKEIDEAGVKIAGAMFSSGSEDSSSTNIENFEIFSKDISKYQWGRTFNLVYSVDGLSGEKKKVIESIVKSLETKIRNFNLVDIKYKIKGSESSHSDAEEIEIEKEDEKGKYGIPFYKGEELKRK